MADQEPSPPAPAPSARRPRQATACRARRAARAAGCARRCCSLGPFVALTVGALRLLHVGPRRRDRQRLRQGRRRASSARKSRARSPPSTCARTSASKPATCCSRSTTARSRSRSTRADAQLAAIDDFVESTRASYRQALEQLALARTNAAYEQRELDRLAALAERKLASEVDVDEARHKRDVANQEIQVTERALDQIRARLGGDLDRPVTEQAAYLAAKSIARRGRARPRAHGRARAVRRHREQGADARPVRAAGRARS